jgi:uncharacterized membrane protein YfcA
MCIFPIEYFLILIIIGIVVGIVSGLLGVGGGFLLVPFQFFLLNYIGIDHELALRVSLGTSLAIISPTAIFSTYNHYANVKYDLKPGLILGVFGIIGGFFGGLTAVNLPYEELEILLGVIFILLAINLFINSNKNIKNNKNFNNKDFNNNNNNNNFNNNFNNHIIINNINKNIDNINNNYINNTNCNDKTNNLITNTVYDKLNFNITYGGLIGVGIGFLSGLFSLGGGVFLIPVLLVLGFSMIDSIRTSSIFISITAIGGTISYLITQPHLNTMPFLIGYVNLVNLGVIAMFSIPLTYFGVKLSYKFNEQRLKQIFAFFMIYIGLKILGLDPFVLFFSYF